MIIIIWLFGEIFGKVWNFSEFKKKWMKNDQINYIKIYKFNNSLFSILEVWHEGKKRFWPSKILNGWT